MLYSKYTLDIKTIVKYHINIKIKENDLCNKKINN